MQGSRSGEGFPYTSESFTCCSLQAGAIPILKLKSITRGLNNYLSAERPFFQADSLPGICLGKSGSYRVSDGAFLGIFGQVTAMEMNSNVVTDQVLSDSGVFSTTVSSLFTFLVFKFNGIMEIGLQTQMTWVGIGSIRTC